MSSCIKACLTFPGSEVLGYFRKEYGTNPRALTCIFILNGCGYIPGISLPSGAVRIIFGIIFLCIDDTKNERVLGIAMIVRGGAECCQLGIILIAVDTIFTIGYSCIGII